MNDEKEILNLFQVEELEKRYEMSWGDNYADAILEVHYGQHPDVGMPDGDIP